MVKPFRSGRSRSMTKSGVYTNYRVVSEMGIYRQSARTNAVPVTMVLARAGVREASPPTQNPSFGGFASSTRPLTCLPNKATDFPSDLPCELVPKILLTIKHASFRRTRLRINQTSCKAEQLPPQSTSNGTRQVPYQPCHEVISQQFDGCAAHG